MCITLSHALIPRKQKPAAESPVMKSTKYLKESICPLSRSASAMQKQRKKWKRKCGVGEKRKPRDLSGRGRAALNGLAARLAGGVCTKPSERISETKRRPTSNPSRRDQWRSIGWGVSAQSATNSPSVHFFFSFFPHFSVHPVIIAMCSHRGPGPWWGWFSCRWDD